MSKRYSKTLGNIISKYPLTGYHVLMFLVVGSVLFNLHAYWNSPPPPLSAPLTITFALLAIVPLARRRLFLISALMFVMATFVVFDVFNVTREMYFSSIASIISIFSAAAYGGNRRNLACTASILVYNGGMMYKLMSGGNIVFLSSATFFNVFGLLWNLVTFLVIWWLGNTLRLSHEHTLQLRENTDQLVRGREENALRAVLDKCVRIAQEVYNGLAHHVSVMVTKTGKELAKWTNTMKHNITALLDLITKDKLVTLEWSNTNRRINNVMK